MRPSRRDKYGCFKVVILLTVLLILICLYKNLAGSITRKHLVISRDDTMPSMLNLKNPDTRQDFDNEDPKTNILEIISNIILKNKDVNTKIEKLNRNECEICSEIKNTTDGLRKGTTAITNNPGNELNMGSSLKEKATGSVLFPTGQDKNIFNNKGTHHWTISKRGQYSETLFNPPPNEIPKRRFPQAIIIGFAKCGTRALLDFLRIHPNIVTAGAEIHFFDRDENYNKGLDWYLAQMPFSYSNQITMEKTPFYVKSRRAMNDIYNINRDIKLIVLIKDPVDRILSFLLQHNISVSQLSVSVIDDHLDDSRFDVNTSKYVIHLRPWIQKFPKSQIHIVEGTEFVQNPVKEVQKIEKFLGVPPLLTEYNYVFNKTKGFYCSRQFYDKQIHCYSDNKGNHHPTLDPVVEKKLYSHFHDINEDLFRLIGKRFLWEPKNELKNIQ